MAKFEGTIYAGNLAITGIWETSYTTNQAGDIESYGDILAGLEDGRPTEAWSIETNQVQGINITSVIEA